MLSLNRLSFSPLLSFCLCSLCLLPFGSLLLSAEPEEEKPENPLPRLSVDEARERAILLHGVYASTLNTLHRHYFEANKTILPARAMEDIFRSLEQDANIKANWIAVNTRAMSVHHEPETAFEKQAAKELNKGKDSYERIEDGYLYRAGPINLGGDCLKCHTSSFTGNFSTSRLAGLVLAIPIETEKD